MGLAIRFFHRYYCVVMPELPEVETIRRQLLPHLPLSIKRVYLSAVVSSILKTTMFRPDGKTLVDIQRKGKLLNFIFKDGCHIISGLGMSGGWRVADTKIREKHTHIQFQCENQNGVLYLGYVDPRRFGNCHFVDHATANHILSKLGVDIGTQKFNAAYVRRACERFPNREIKPFLLDQKYFAGAGNYIACEILAHGRIHPARLAGTLTHQEHKNIVSATRAVLSGSLKQRGLTFSGGYTDATGRKGDALNTLVVFHQQICGLCEHKSIIQITLKGRNTYFCANCQK